MSDFEEVDYDMSEDSRSEEDDVECLEELYNNAKAEPSSEAQLRRFDELFSVESAMQTKTVWGFNAAKRLLKNALEQPNVEAITTHYQRLLSYANTVATNDFERCMLKTVNRLASLSQTEILHALISISTGDMTFTTASTRTAIKVAQALIRLQPNEDTLGCLTDLQHCLEATNAVSKTTTNRCLSEVYALEMELLWCMGKFENMDVVYGKVRSMENSMLASHHLSSAHGYYGRYLLRRNRPADALECLAKAVKGYQVTSVADEHHIACVQSLAVIAYTSAISSADELLDEYGGRLDVAAIRRFGVAFLSADVAALERAFDEFEDTFKDREVRRLLRHCESALKRKLCLK
ncbi:hypothetical protein AAVH_26112 [Aphelenchoides avenae]|nr:hypothetical protein AAVH_26112 [Aphelenchus avenae]